MTYGSWDMQWERQNWLSFWAIFCLFTPLTAQKIKILKNEKSIWRCRQFTHACTCNFHNLYASWDMECDRHNFLSFSAIFCPFTQLTCWKIKIFKKKKKNIWRYHHFTLVYYKWRSYDVWFLRYRVRQNFSHFVPFLPFYPPKNPEMQNIEKTNKKTNKRLQISSFYTSLP